MDPSFHDSRLSLSLLRCGGTQSRFWWRRGERGQQKGRLSEGGSGKRWEVSPWCLHPRAPEQRQGIAAHRQQFVLPSTSQLLWQALKGLSLPSKSRSQPRGSEETQKPRWKTLCVQFLSLWDQPACRRSLDVAGKSSPFPLNAQAFGMVQLKMRFGVRRGNSALRPGSSSQRLVRSCWEFWHQESS